MLGEARQFAIEIVSRLRSAGFVALWAGGCVRDLLMEHEPHDYDVATSATPEQVRALFGFRRTFMVGAAFGVVIVRGSSKLQHQVEVATFRTDAAYSDGRRPDSVTYSTPQKDAERRDFTINGMFFDPLAEEVIDYVGGRSDLRNGIVRAIGDPHARLAEDKLRMLRAVRFAARFGFEIDPETQAAIAAHAPEVALVSGERIAIEFRKTLQTERAAWAVARWRETDLLHVIAPEVNQYWDRIGESACELVRKVEEPDWLARAAALYWPLVDSAGRGPLIDAKQGIGALKQRLRLANEEAEAILFALDSQAELARATRLAWSQVQPLLIKPHIRSAVVLLMAQSVGDPLLEAEVAWLKERLHWPPEKLNPPPWLNGKDLRQCGLVPGPPFRLILQEARDLQLDGQIADRPAALDWLSQRCRALSQAENGS